MLVMRRETSGYFRVKHGTIIIKLKLGSWIKTVGEKFHKRQVSPCHKIGTVTELSLKYINVSPLALRMLFYVSDLLARKMTAEIVTHL